MSEPRHRSTRPVDACSMLVAERWRRETPCTPGNGGACADYPPRHVNDPDPERADESGQA